MKIYAEKDVLAEVGQSVLRVISPRVALPVLGGVRVAASGGSVEFAATDLEAFVSVGAEFAVEEEGTVVLPGRLFGEILRSLPAGKVAIEGDEGEVRVKAGTVEFSVSGLPVADFPSAPEVSGGLRKIDSADLSGALRQVVRAASLDEARPVLTGVLWALEGETLRLAATDSYRLAVRELVVKESGDPATAIIPGRALAELGRLLSDDAGAVSVQLGETQASFSAGRVNLLTRLIEGEFPNYRQLIPESYSNKLTASKEALAQAVERVALVARENTPIQLHLGDEIQLTATEAGVADAWEALEGAEYSGEQMVVAFNPRFLADGISAVTGDTVTVEATDPTKAVVLKSTDADDFLYLVMPVRLRG